MMPVAGAWKERIARVVHAASDIFLPATFRGPDVEEAPLLRARAFIRVTLLIHLGLVILYLCWAALDGPFTPAALAWGAYALLLLGNLVLVRLTGRFHEITIANNLLGLVMIATLLSLTGGLASPLLPLFLVGVATTGNFGGARPILIFFGAFMLVLTGVYLWQCLDGAVADLHARYAFLITAAVLAVLSNLSAQSTRSKTRRMLKQAHDEAVAGRFMAEQAQGEAERALAQLRAAQSHLILQEKMASLGSLVAGVAHEVNTPIGLSVTGATQLRADTQEIATALAQGKLTRSRLEAHIAVASELATLVERNAVRAAELIQSFKDVAVDQSSDARRSFEMRPYVTEVVANLSPRLRKGRHQVVIDIPDGILLDGYPGGLAQVITNLIINSLVHGYPDPRPAHIRIQVRRLPDDRIELDYRDDGIGIPEPVRQRIFEPFFTTKRGSGGSGLGLHLVYNIVTLRLGGTVTVSDHAEGGARFLIILPLRAPDPESGTATLLDISQ